MNMYPTRRRTNPLPRILFLLIVVGGLGFLVYKTQSGNVLTLRAHPTVVVDDCFAGSVKVRTNTSSNQVIAQNMVWSIFTPSSYNQERNLVIINACDIVLTVPVNTDLSIKADRIDVTGVTGKMELDTNGGMITLLQTTLQGKSVISNNGGTTRFNGSFAAESISKFDNNGGLVDITVPHTASFQVTTSGGIDAASTNVAGLYKKDQGISGSVGSPPYPKLVLSTNGSTVVLKQA